ncbi:DUF3564 family protein [Burkholderia sp. Bp9017]|uniref:DUF3564 family protein n=1 Tax=Burkholderia TaxID=32008 RepID=UPI000F5FBC2D|nr:MULTISPECIES: DUF3564 family protein [Burkholderia]MBY4866559.1 DUF3564 domain-containing protein [Burkholderia anthina]RQZ23736.1 DUF3564 family protein [Burkholderia sp. Bp9017]
MECGSQPALPRAGIARRLCDAGLAPVPGTWRVQWVDDTVGVPEHGVFTGSEAD